MDRYQEQRLNEAILRAEAEERKREAAEEADRERQAELRRQREEEAAAARRQETQDLEYPRTH